MKTLMLFRHAESSWNDDSLLDHDRPLNERGQQDASLMGKFIKKQRLVPDLVLSSTAVRAHTTAAAAAETAGFVGEIQLNEQLYLASEETLVESVQTLPNETAVRVLVVAHNPGMEKLVQMLSGRFQIKFPTAALAIFSIGTTTWRALQMTVECQLVHLWRPKDLWHSNYTPRRDP